jgi:peptidyl-prolyl cis-trans isomerase SurA
MAGSAVLALAAGSACTSPTQPLQTTKAATSSLAATDPAAEEAKAAEAKIIQQKASVSQKGTYIRVLVNGSPVTNSDIQRRAKFRQLRRLKASQEETIKELVDEKIKMTAAEERGVVASDQQVDDAFANFAKGNRATPAQMAGELNRIGVGADHFKEFIRAQITWSRMAGAQLQSQTLQKSQAETINELRKSGQQKPETTEYLLQQIIFVVPKDKLPAGAKARMGEAEAFRAAYQGCSGAIQQAKGYRDVAVKDLGRLLQPELPPLWKEKVAGLQEGQITIAQATDKGVEMIGICRAQATDDDRAAHVIAQSKTFESLEQKGDTAADGFLDELRKKSTIVYR